MIIMIYPKQIHEHKNWYDDGDGKNINDDDDDNMTPFLIRK